MEPSQHVRIEGHVSAGFAAVRDAFAENFSRRHELGGACCVYHRGEKVVDLWRVTAALIGAMLLSGTLFAWQLASRTLAERVNDADVIVVGSVGTIQSRAPSPISGVGDVWLVTLRVSTTLKGSLPVDARVSFADAAVEDQYTFRTSQERVWLLKTSTDRALFSASASYQSVLLASEAARIRTALRSAAPQR